MHLNQSWPSSGFWLSFSDRLQCGATPSLSKEAWELVMKTKTGLHFPGCHLTRKKQAKLTFRDQGDWETEAQERWLVTQERWRHDPEPLTMRPAMLCGRATRGWHTPDSCFKALLQYPDLETPSKLLWDAIPWALEETGFLNPDTAAVWARWRAS